MACSGSGVALWLERRTHDQDGRRFESPQERWEHFFLQGQLSVLTYFSIRSTPVLPQEHVKDPGSAGGRL